jgi:hypothetical protein
MKDVQVGCVRFATIVALGLLANAMPGHLRPAAAETVRDACTHDAFRLCSNTIPNVGRTKACLARHRNSLSPKCQAAFSGGTTRQRAADRNAHKPTPDRSAHEPSPDRSAPGRDADRSASERDADRSAQEPSPDRSAHERHHRTHARHYCYYRGYRHYRRFHLFPFF